MGSFRNRFTLGAFLALGLPQVASAAELTDIIDASDGQDPFDFNLEPSFRIENYQAGITREGICTPDGPNGSPERCSEPRTVYNREADWSRTVNALDIRARMGLFRDLELNFNLPIILSDTQSLQFSDGVVNSAIDPSDSRISDDLDPNYEDDYGTAFGTYSFSEMPFSGPTRSGLGDISIGMGWQPWNHVRMPWLASFRFQLDYTAPTGKIRQGLSTSTDNSGVGLGLHSLHLGVASSRQMTYWLEPFFSFDLYGHLAAKNGLFQASDTSRSTMPLPSAEFTVGAEFVMFEDEESGQRYSLTVQPHFGVQLEGRGYTEIAEMLSHSDCNGITPGEAGLGADPDGNAYQPNATVSAEQAACAWVLQQPGNADPSEPYGLNTPHAHDGITDYESYANVGMGAGFNLQFNDYVELRMAYYTNYRTPHFISSASPGINFNDDADGQAGTVDLDPTPENGVVERNPNYNLALDSVGTRFRLETAWEHSVSFDLALQF